jgi:hypothetical protein
MTAAVAFPRLSLAERDRRWTAVRARTLSLEFRST